MSKARIDYLRSFHTKIDMLIEGLYCYMPWDSDVSMSGEDVSELKELSKVTGDDELDALCAFSKECRDDTWPCIKVQLNIIKYRFDVIESMLCEAAETIDAGTRKYNCQLAQDAMVIMTTLHFINERARKEIADLQDLSENDESRGEHSPDDDRANEHLYKDLKQKHHLIKEFYKDLMLIKTKVLLEIQSTEVVKLKMKEAEAVVKEVLDSFPNRNWSARSLSQYLLEELNCQYSHVSIGGLNAWEEWLATPKGHGFRNVSLTDTLLKSVDSAGKTYFSRDKKAANFSNDDD